MTFTMRPNYWRPNPFFIGAGRTREHVVNVLELLPKSIEMWLTRTVCFIDSVEVHYAADLAYEAKRSVWIPVTELATAKETERKIIHDIATVVLNGAGAGSAREIVRRWASQNEELQQYL